MPAKDRKRKAEPSYLERRNGVWWVQVAVPMAARPYITSNKKVLRACLGTKDEQLAREEKGQYVTDFKRQIRAALSKAGKKEVQYPMPDHIAKGLAQRQYGYPEEMLLEKARADVPDVPEHERQFKGITLSGVDTALRRLEYVDAALGQHTPLLIHLGSFIKNYSGRDGNARAARTVEARRHSIESFGKWLEAEKIPPIIEMVNRRVATRYKEQIIAKGAARETINKSLGGLRLYWQWLVDAGYINETPNPWDRQSVGQRDTGDHSHEEEVYAYELRPDFPPAMRWSARRV